ncbi:MAG: AAA family ATPase [Patescibacteria group bacterium]
MKRFYITGVSGTGKSSVGEKLQEKGITVIDLDVRENRLTHWRNNDTSEISHWHSGIGNKFFDEHSYIVDIEKLVALMDSYKDKDAVTVIGLADNPNFVNLIKFDKVFLFQCNKEIFIKRITERTNHNFGNDASEREWILSWYEDYEKEMLDKGAIPINTEGPLDEVVENIVSKINS